ncbi:insulinase family protein [Deinococcus sp. HMF7604]|uniref:M16 family metallopeptidase n=1 Tax=Deinococcus betulae TaxID=2873312 RepID=UPI001CCC755F|nr:pitrilysin family protein [Deinococcus betulae]MBZ9750060.1 insulinase family protein [Deinococcus betulae]
MPAAPPSAHLWTLPGGLRVAFERRRSPGFAFDLRLPVGSAHDPAGQEGASGVLEEWLFKGAGGRSARALQDAFDDLGVRRGGGVGPEATRLSVSGLQADLRAALALCADVLMRPDLPEAEVPVLTDLARQDLDGVQDSPADLLALEARAAAFPRPLGSPFAGYAHPVSGTPGGLTALSPAALRAHLTRYGQAGTVLGLVADLDPAQAHALAQEVLGDLRPGAADEVPADFQAGGQVRVPHEDAEQTHLSVLCPGVAPHSPDWLAWQLAVGALSGGSASRLFHSVREERGLAYAVSASPLVLGGQGFLSLYAGSTPDRAPETLEVLLSELARLPQGLTAAEFGRARAGLSSSVVFGAESLRGRAHALTRDTALFGSPRAPADLRAAVEALSLDGVNAFLAGYDPAAQATVVTLGPVGNAVPPLSAPLETTHV